MRYRVDYYLSTGPCRYSKRFWTRRNAERHAIRELENGNYVRGEIHDAWQDARDNIITRLANSEDLQAAVFYAILLVMLATMLWAM